MDSTFVRKDFYIQPPGKGASVEEWNDWLARDSRKASAAKAQHTKAQVHAPVPTWLEGESTVSKRNGVHSQGLLVGFTGDAEQGTCQVERVCPKPLPDELIDIKARLSDIAMHTNMRGGTRLASEVKISKAHRRHAARKAKLRLIQGGKRG